MCVRAHPGSGLNALWVVFCWWLLCSHLHCSLLRQAWMQSECRRSSRCPGCSFLRKCRFLSAMLRLTALWLALIKNTFAYSLLWKALLWFNAYNGCSWELSNKYFQLKKLILKPSIKTKYVVTFVTSEMFMLTCRLALRQARDLLLSFFGLFVLLIFQF